MIHRRSTAAALLGALSCLAFATPPVALAEEVWCGNSTADWACRLTGRVEVGGHSVQQRAVPANSLITTFAHAQAHITFASEAWCTLGQPGVRSSMRTRPPGEGTLFRLSTGSSTCFNPSGEGAIKVLCVDGERCPVEVEARGVSLIRVDPETAASASSASVIHRAARIISCGGLVRVALASEVPGMESPDEVSGSGSYGQPFEIFVSQTIESSFWAGSSSLTVENSSATRTLSRPGLCSSEPTQEVHEASTETTTVVSNNGNVVIG